METVRDKSYQVYNMDWQEFYDATSDGWTLMTGNSLRSWWIWKNLLRTTRDLCMRETLFMLTSEELEVPAYNVLWQVKTHSLHWYLSSKTLYGNKEELWFVPDGGIKIFESLVNIATKALIQSNFGLCMPWTTVGKTWCVLKMLKTIFRTKILGTDTGVGRSTYSLIQCLCFITGLTKQVQ